MLLVWRYNLLQESMYHLITGKRNDRRRSCSQQISCTTAVKTRKAFLLEHLPNTIDNPFILDSIVSGQPLLLQPGSHYLISQISSMTTKAKHERTEKDDWPSTAVHKKEYSSHIYLMRIGHHRGNHFCNR